MSTKELLQEQKHTLWCELEISRDLLERQLTKTTRNECKKLIKEEDLLLITKLLEDVTQRAHEILVIKKALEEL